MLRPSADQVTVEFIPKLCSLLVHRCRVADCLGYILPPAGSFLSLVQLVSGWPQLTQEGPAKLIRLWVLKLVSEYGRDRES
jgi:hypothetical protein